jgi:hypothetical protein
VALGGSDCEVFHDGWLAQPVNAWSSLAFAVAGVCVLVRARSADVDVRLCVVGGASLVLVAAGSFGYHGPQTPGSHFAHDGSIVLLLGVVGFAVVRRVRRGRSPAPRPAYVALALGAAAWLLGRTDGALCDPDSPLQLHAAWHVLAALAAGAFLLARPRVTTRRRGGMRALRGR